MKNKIVTLTLVTLLITGAMAQTGNLPKVHKEKQNLLTKFGKAGSISLPQNIMRWSWDQTNAAWDYPNADIITYDIAGNPIITNSEYYYNGGQDTSRNRRIQTYNARNQETFSYSFYWNNNLNQWDTSYKTIYTYDAFGTQLSNEGSNFNQSLGVWEFNYGYKTIPTYDANNRISSEISQEWFKHLNTYRNSSKSDYGFNAQGEINELIISEWDTINSTFNLKGRYTNIVWFAFDINNMDDSKIGSLVMQGWNGTAYNDSSRMSITYDTHENEIEMLGESKVGSNWVFDYQSKNTLTYNGADQLTEKILQYKENAAGSLKNEAKEQYSNFLIFSGVKGAKLNSIELVIYPNPMTSSVTIQLNTEASKANGVFELYNLLGTEVYRTSINSPTTTFEKGSIPQGIYYYQVTSNNNTIATGKLIIQ